MIIYETMWRDSLENPKRVEEIRENKQYQVEDVNSTLSTSYILLIDSEHIRAFDAGYQTTITPFDIEIENYAKKSCEEFAMW